MAAAAQNTNNTTIRSILLAKKLIRPHFTNWYRNLRIVLRSEGKLSHLEQPLIPLHLPVAPQAMRDTYEVLYDAQSEVACIMLGSMYPDLQRALENYKAYNMIQELKTMFEEQAKQELFETVKAFHACKQEDGQSVGAYILKMKGYLDTLECLGYAMPNELGVSLILNSLNKDYDQFVHNYNMHSIGKSIVEFHAMLKLHEKGILKKAETLAVLAIREGKIQKDKKKPQGEKGKDKGKNKLAYAPNPKIPSPPKIDNPAKDSTCHHCKEGLRGSIKLKHGALSLYVGNGMRAAVEVIESFDLVLPSDLIIVLDNYHFAPIITRGVVSISHLINNGYIHAFTNYGIFVSKDNVLYFNAIPRDGIYEIDMHNLYPNVSSMFNVSNKRAKHALDSSYLWHCRLGHINKKCMGKLQRDGILQLTHDESLEKCKTMSREGASYFITFTDDFSRYGYVYLMKHKHEVFETFKVFQNEVENKLGKKIKAIRFDRGGKYMSHEFVNHMKSCGIVSQLTLPYTPQHNGVYEMRNRTLLDMVRSMMNLTALPKSFWGYAIESVVRILNMVPTKKVKRTPYKLWYEKASKLSCLRVWVCEALVKRDTPEKLNPRSIKCIFVGYPKETMGYYFYYPLENNIFVARNAEFFENSLMVQEASGSHGLFESSCTYPESDKWLEAMNTEMQSMKDNQVWVLVELPPNGRTVGSKWIFKKKTDMDGKVHTFKACLVAKCYTQTYGVDYGEILSLVADIGAIRILLAIVAFHDYEIWQIDVKTAFLNGHLTSRSWNKRFDVEIKKIGFTQNLDEPCVYLKASGSNVAFLILYVDDILLMGNNVTMLQEVKSWLCKCFSMKDLGEAAYILGIKIIRDRSKRLIALSQSAYLEKILKKFWMENSKKGYTPMIEKPDYRKSQGAKTPSEVQRMQRVPYASAIGSIMYAVRCTRPDVAFAQNLCSRFQQNPGEIHWTAVKAILKYLRNTKDMVLVYEAKPEAELKVSCYVDASFQTNKDDTKSSTGYVFILNGGSMDLKGAKQSTNAMYSIEAVNTIHPLKHGSGGLVKWKRKISILFERKEMRWEECVFVERKHTLSHFTKVSFTPPWKYGGGIYSPGHD
ncbi:retrotransposon protein, putative, ty1-copia subclass [Tanacetum coccineum]